MNEDVDSIRQDAWQRESPETLQSATAMLTEDARSVGAAMASLLSAATKVCTVAYYYSPHLFQVLWCVQRYYIV